MISIIPIGTKVIANDCFVGIVISASIRKTNVLYEVQKTTEDSSNVAWFNDWEITSKHKKQTIIDNLIREN